MIGVIGYNDLDDAVPSPTTAPTACGPGLRRGHGGATSVARRIRAGAVSVNSGMFSAYAPVGATSRAASGRERGVEGVRAFQEVKHLVIGELR